jgi:hypothetical protein
MAAGLLQLPQGRRIGGRGLDGGGAAAEVDPVVVQEEERLLGIPRVHGLSAGGRLRRAHEHGHQEEARHHPQGSLVRTLSINIYNQASYVSVLFCRSVLMTIQSSDDAAGGESSLAMSLTQWRGTS